MPAVLVAPPSHSSEVPLSALPYPVARLIDAALVGELTVVGEHGRPITYPMTPLLWSERIYMTSSTLDSAKVAHIKTNPRVTLSITDMEATGSTRGRVTVQCDARVSEDDLQHGWERLLQGWTRKDPSVRAMFSTRLAFPLLLERVLIELTPRKTWYWPDGDTEKPPQIAVAAEVAR
jgi:general stress protein 26